MCAGDTALRCFFGHGVARGHSMWNLCWCRVCKVDCISFTMSNLTRTFQGDNHLYAHSDNIVLQFFLKKIP
jgi:hypothetical protein